MGLPTVAYDKPVAREILGPAGVLVPSGDTAALGAACSAFSGIRATGSGAGRRFASAR
jgi:glycosyltransferase involved in cell wall biosynthesis